MGTAPTRALRAALDDAGGPDAPRELTAQLRGLLLAALEYGAAELEQPRSGYTDPVAVAFTGRAERLLAALPIDAGFRADPARANERAWLGVAAAVGALFDAAELAAPASADELVLRAGGLDRWLVLAVPVSGEDEAAVAELAAMAYDDHVASVDRLRAIGVAAPASTFDGLDDPAPPIGSGHPLRSAEAVARLGGRPADRESVQALEEAVLGVLAPESSAVRPHDDPDPTLRVARRLLQRLSGMGKWGGYHTDISHLPRGFATHERDRVLTVADMLIEGGLLVEKNSVGQRHVYLNPRRVGEIAGLVDRGEVPPGVHLR